jgi:alkylation response protein AidB-like acyl-CoA dehydrogenase
MGYCGVLVPERHGGLGLGHVEAGIVMERIGHQLAASPFLETGIAAATAIRHGGTEAQQRAWLPRLARGELVVALAVDEWPKHRPMSIATSARAHGDGHVLDGDKTFVVDGHVADVLVVAARTSGSQEDAAGISLFVVERAAAGVEVERTVMVDARNAARVRLAGVHVGADALLGPLHGGWPTLSAALDAARAGAAAELLGIADEVFERTLQYLKERRQFGRAIGEFQALQHRAAMLYCDLELARAALLHAQQRLDADVEGAGAAVAVAKSRAGRTATLAVQEALQMHGGIGMTDEFEIGFFMKRARVLQELYGDANHHADALARQHGY